MSQVVIRPQAHHDVIGLALHIGQDSPAAGERLLDAFEYTSNLLAASPTLGATCAVASKKIQGLRTVAIRGFPNHVILYRPLDAAMEIVRVIHGARDLGHVIDEIE